MSILGLISSLCLAILIARPHSKLPNTKPRRNGLSGAALALSMKNAIAILFPADRPGLKGVRRRDLDSAVQSILGLPVGLFNSRTVVGIKNPVCPGERIQNHVVGGRHRRGPNLIGGIPNEGEY